jgi:hypothetical protein
MKRSTPVIMGILLIVAVAALGYLDQFHNQTNNSSTNISFIGEHPLTGHLKSVSPLNATPLKKQQGTSVNVSTSNKTVQNNTNSTQNQNSTSSNPSGS